MEAMRLSLLDHEEHQRKEAETTRNAAAAAPGQAEAPAPSTSSTLNVPGTPSTTISNPVTPSKNGTSSSSTPMSNASPLSSSPAPGRQSPAPPTAAPHSDPISTLQGLGKHRSPSPQPFSTLSAAIGASSMATAVFGNGSGGISTPPNSSARTPVPAVPAGTTPVIISSPPNSDDAAPQPQPLPLPSNNASQASVDSVASVDTVGASSASPYSVLGSSPESTMSHVPLLDVHETPGNAEDGGSEE